MMPPKPLTLADIDKLIGEKTHLVEIYIDQYYFQMFKMLASVSYSYDERGEFFWFGTRKIRPLPYLKAAVIRRNSQPEAENEFELRLLVEASSVR